MDTNWIVQYYTYLKTWNSLYPPPAAAAIAAAALTAVYNQTQETFDLLTFCSVLKRLWMTH